MYNKDANYMICLRCGQECTYNKYPDDYKNADTKHCEYCGSDRLFDTEKTEHEWWAEYDNIHGTKGKSRWPEVVEHIKQQCLYNNPDYDPNLASIIQKQEQDKREADKEKLRIESLQTPHCPGCASTSFVTVKKGIGVGSVIKGAAGVAIAGPWGAAAGLIGSGKFINVCQSCGRKWEPGR